MRLGIDLGTSNSSVAFFDRIAGDLSNVKISTGDEPYDSILKSCALLNGAQVKIGSVAEREYRANPNSVFIPTFKPYLNETHLRKAINVKKGSIEIGYNYHRQEPLWRDVWETEYIGARFSKKELMMSIQFFLSDILSKSQIEITKQGEICNGYLVGIPLNAKLHYRFRLLEALKNASPLREDYSSILRRTLFIPEPVAVSFCFRERIDEEDDVVLIFDYGGGTLDLAMLKYDKVQDYILPTRLLGLSCLDKAGNHINEILKEYLFEKYPGYKDKFDQLDSVHKYFEEQQIENLKIKLSRQETVGEKLFSGLDVKISTSEFKGILAGLIADIDKCIEQCCSDASLVDYGKVKKVIMSGGSSLIPVIQEHMKEIFGAKRVISQNPKNIQDVEIALTGVSRGLASYDYFIEMSGLQSNMYQVWNHNNGNFETVLERNEKTGAIEYEPYLRGYEASTICIFYNMIKEEPLIALVNLPVQIKEKWKVRISHENIFNTLPKIEIYNGFNKTIFSCNLSEMDEIRAKKMITSCDWRVALGNKQSWIIPSVPIELGNIVRVGGRRYEVADEVQRQMQCFNHETCKNKGKRSACKDGACDEGIIAIVNTGIREIKTGIYMKSTNNWDLSKYVFELIDAEHRTSIRKNSFCSYDIQIDN